jgi:outer membrane protein assembly factor BamA
VTAAERAIRAFVITLVVALLPALGGAQPRPAQPAPSTPGAPRPILIRELAIQGNRRVQEALILGRIRSVVGVPFNPSQASDDVRSIFTLGFFDDVQLKVEDFEGGVKLTFVVMERPFVRDVEFTGNSRLNTADLQEKIDLKLGSVYNPVDVERAKEKIKEAYEDEGYFEIQVGSAVEKFGDGDVKVVFTVNEGRRITIEKIVFKGNKGLKDSIIKDAMITKERQLFILRGTVQRQKLEEDIDRIVGVREPGDGPGHDHDRDRRGPPVQGRPDQVHRADAVPRGRGAPAASLQDR